MEGGLGARAWRAMREVAEGAEPDFERLAAIRGCSVARVRRVARRQGWRELAALDAEALERRLLVLADGIVSELEAASGKKRQPDKGRLDVLSARLRMVEKLGEMARVPARAAETQKKDDEELAAALALVDARILELARELAASMGGEAADGEVGAPDPG